MIDLLPVLSIGNISKLVQCERGPTIISTKKWVVVWHKHLKLHEKAEILTPKAITGMKRLRKGVH